MDTTINLKAGLSIGRIFFVIVLLELFLMGSGRLLEINGVTLRMVFFLVCCFIVLYRIFNNNSFSEFTVAITCFFIFLICTASFLGNIAGSDNASIFEDVKPLSYFLMLLYFDAVITTGYSIKLIVSLVKLSSVILSILYITAFCLLLSGYIQFADIYQLLEESSDFMFRENLAFFYKGFLYICIGMIFFLYDKFTVFTLISICILATAVLLTLTKGFVFALVLIVALGYSIKLKKKFILIPIIAVLLAITISSSFIYSEALGDKSASDEIRITTITQVFDDINLKSFFVGHGFGQGVLERPIHMEISFLEIFHKQGMLGVLFWIALIGIIIKYYRKACKFGHQHIALPFFLSVIFIYLESLTNPFMNNPIGLSFILISLVVLRLLSTEKMVPITK